MRRPRWDDVAGSERQSTEPIQAGRTAENERRQYARVLERLSGSDVVVELEVMPKGISGCRSA